jgi:phosphoglycerol transferase MdoB-like AlkP superfamily enzyme
MNEHPGAPVHVTRRAFFLWAIAWLVAAHSVERILLLAGFAPVGTWPVAGAKVLAVGLVMDVFVAMVVALPFLVWSLVVPDRWFRAGWHRWMFWGAGFVFWLIAIFLLCAEWFFFDEFKSRFNTVSIDYLIYPHETFVNIRDSYPVGWVVAGCALLAALWVAASRQLFRAMWTVPVRCPTRLGELLVVAGLVAVLVPFVGNRLTRFSTDRVQNELAGNGWYSGIQAAVTRDLDYRPFYRTVPLDEAYERARQLVSETNSVFLEEGHSLRRRVGGDPAKPRLNVVLFLEESLGSEFLGCLGRPTTLTPELDRLANEEGMLFTHLYASGNRTVRGMEGVLCSFPPLPGDSVVVRDRAGTVDTLAHVFQRDGYSTTFLYAGRGVFDHLRPFMTANGFERFIEQKDFVNPAFSTIWGVCNEDLYGRALEECRVMAQSDKPFFVAMLSVSNHKPFTFPKGRIAENPDKRRRTHAVKYTDWALGQFFRAAKQEAFYTNTLFVVVADHGARVYGRQTIPMPSYEIPLLVLGPAVGSRPSRVATLGGQLDVAPTVLGLIGRPYECSFFGRNLLSLPPQTGRALLHHNRDIGLYEGERMAVLGLNQSVEYFHGDPRTEPLRQVDKPDELDGKAERDAAALFLVADDLYRTQRLRPAGSRPALAQGRSAVR